MIAAWVDGEPIAQARVDAELRRLYDGPAGAALPAPETTEGRQLRRWLVQVLAVVSVLEYEATRRGLAGSAAGATANQPPPAARPAPDEPVAAWPAAARAELGGIASAALARARAGDAVFQAIAGAVTVTEPDVDRYRAANPELVAEETRLVRHVRAGRPVNGGRPYRMRRSDLLGDLVFAVAPGAVVRDGPDTLEVLDVAETAVPDLAATLLDAARDRAFARWLDVQLRDRVVLAPGSEHPADPAQPDHTHRH